MKPLLNTVLTPVPATRDGNTGMFAKIILPFSPQGYWFASGATYTWPTSLMAQDSSMVIRGTNMFNTFQKDCCTLCAGH